MKEYNVKEELTEDTFQRSCVFAPEYDHSKYHFGMFRMMHHEADPSAEESTKHLLESVDGFWGAYQRYIKKDEEFGK